MKKTIEQMAIEERRAYFRKWRQENKEKVKKHNATYWKKRAAKKINSQTVSKAGERYDIIDNS